MEMIDNWECQTMGMKENGDGKQLGTADNE